MKIEEKPSSRYVFLNNSQMKRQFRINEKKKREK